MTGQSRGSLKTLNIGQLSWIGGVDTDSKEMALKRAGTSTGIYGFNLISNTIFDYSTVSRTTTSWLDFKVLLFQSKIKVLQSRNNLSILNN